MEDFIFKFSRKGVTNVMLNERSEYNEEEIDDIYAGIAAQVAPIPVSAADLLIDKKSRFQFGIFELDQALELCEGLIEIQGRAKQGKTMLCRRAVSNALLKQNKVLYVNISKCNCDAFAESLNYHENLVTLPCFDIKSLICICFGLSRANPYGLVVIDGISPLLFSIEDWGQANELCKELEGLLKRLSIYTGIIVTSSVNDEGNLIAAGYWNNSIPESLYIEEVDTNEYECKHIHEKLITIKFKIS
ncbi:unnamed protein product [Blepharisma stoltei]|uniref:DNA recombination and repair protein Rad51-like C-terminal domain-containing protein n=1 Tax=Blepharisma stoltei TaxID=1481888 RepID=A0AAU9KJF2_9CILI|nr:unnamed protein product [Blepharisma stoltei]